MLAQAARLASRRSGSWIEDHPSLATLLLLLMVVGGPVVQYTHAAVEAVSMGLEQFEHGEYDVAKRQVALGLGMYDNLPESWRSPADRLTWADAKVISAALATSGTNTTFTANTVRDELHRAVDLYDGLRLDPTHRPEALGALVALEPVLTDATLREQVHVAADALAGPELLRFYRQQMQIYFATGDLSGFRRVEALAAPLTGQERHFSSVSVWVVPISSGVTPAKPTFAVPGATIADTVTAQYRLTVVSSNTLGMGEVDWVENGVDRSALLRFGTGSSFFTVTGTPRVPMLLQGVAQRLQSVEALSQLGDEDALELARLNRIALQSGDLTLRGRLCWGGTLLGSEGATVVRASCESSVSNSTISTSTSAAILDLLGLNRILVGNVAGARTAWDLASRSTNQPSNRQAAEARRTAWLAALTAGGSPDIDSQTLDQVRKEGSPFRFTPRTAA